MAKAFLFIAHPKISYLPKADEKFSVTIYQC
jgi:hypothetical protein